MEDTLGFQIAPTIQFIDEAKTERTRTMDKIARETYVTNLDAETADRANTVASPGCEHRDEILKR